jgi:hypothetical protein
MKPIESKPSKDFPDKLELVVNDVGVVIDYTTGEIGFPCEEILSEERKMSIAVYLKREGFFNSPNRNEK